MNNYMDAVEFCDFLRSLRQVGNTTTTITGALKTNAVVITCTQMEANRIKKEYGVEAVPFHLAYPKLAGRRTPVAIDPWTVVELMSILISSNDKSSARIGKLIQDLAYVKEENDELKREVEARGRDVIKLLRKVDEYEERLRIFKEEV